MIHGLKLKIAGLNESLKKELSKPFRQQNQNKIKKIQDSKSNLRNKIKKIKSEKKKVKK